MSLVFTTSEVIINEDLQQEVEESPAIYINLLDCFITFMGEKFHKVTAIFCMKQRFS